MRDSMRKEKEDLRGLLEDESGSISLLIIGLFIMALSALMVMTDVAVVASAKRTLDQATEAAAMRAVRNLDKDSYYKGKHTILTSVWELAQGGAYSDNRVPIDCTKGENEIRTELSSWFNSMANLKSIHIESYRIDDYQCIYDTVSLKTSAQVKLPFPAPFSDFQNTRINSSISTLNQKDQGLYLFGVRIH